MLWRPRPDPRRRRAFGEVLVNGVEITPELIAQEIRTPSTRRGDCLGRSARALAVRELLVQKRAARAFSRPELDEGGPNRVARTL